MWKQKDPYRNISVENLIASNNNRMRSKNYHKPNTEVVLRENMNRASYAPHVWASELYLKGIRTSEYAAGILEQKMWSWVCLKRGKPILTLRQRRLGLLKCGW